MVKLTQQYSLFFNSVYSFYNSKKYPVLVYPLIFPVSFLSPAIRTNQGEEAMRSTKIRKFYWTPLWSIGRTRTEKYSFSFFPLYSLNISSAITNKGSIVSVQDRCVRKWQHCIEQEISFSGMDPSLRNKKYSYLYSKKKFIFEWNIYTVKCNLDYCSKSKI